MTITLSYRGWKNLDHPTGAQSIGPEPPKIRLVALESPGFRGPGFMTDQAARLAA